MFKKIKSFIFIISFVLSIYSVIRIHTLNIEIERQLLSFYDEYYQWRISEGSYKLESVDDVLLHLKENLALELSLLMFLH